VEEFSPVVAIADTAEQWSDAIQHALGEKENSSQRRAQRQAVARLYEWDALVLKIVRPIAAHFEMSVPDIVPACESQALSAVAVPLS